MKKFIIRLFYITTFAACLYSCKTNVLETENKELDQKYYLTQDTVRGVLNISMKVELPKKYKDLNTLRTIRDNIVEKTFGTEYVRYSNNDLLPAFAKDMYEEYRESNLPFMKEDDTEEPGFTYNNDYILETFSLLNDKHIFSYGSDLYVYTGGAHGLTNRLYYNYDMSNGKLLTETDLFTGNYKSVLTDLLIEHIKNDNNGAEEDFENTYWTEYIIPNGNFYITTESINYVFNPYEIAPYAFGITEVTIPFNQLGDILKKDSPINYLLNDI